ncbi:MAG: cytochrome c oxidase assembly protein, partial [Frankiales bacterium]|nr:cytochrome c oxidase assembly protein [Frankiales bacterium]
MPLTSGRWLTGWSLDLPVLVVVVVAAVVYVAATRRVRGRGGSWSTPATAWFLVGGLGSLTVVTCSFLGTYSRVLFWPLAVQDVLLLTLVPV